MAIAEAAPDVSEGEVEESILAALDEVDVPPTEDGRWRVGDKAQADWALRKLARARQRHAEVIAISRRQIDKINAAVAPHITRIMEWREEELTKLDREVGNWEALLGEFHRTLLGEDDHEKTVDLPHGTLVARKQPDTWETDDEALLAWAEANGVEIIRRKVEVDRPAMKKVLSVATTGEVVWGGEMVPGVQVTPGEVKFSVETEEVGK